ncbi:MAG: O-antigen ligase domain-containing protein [Tannerella sp.]|jgi:hypothetical protein|nr:O-antigen ligase domain-containing protein [Tannerella sp.]
MQKFINEAFFYVFTLAYIVGMLLYHLPGFDITDEIYTVVIFILFLYYMFRQSDWGINKVFLLIIGIFIFYLIYSINIQSNSTIAILKDFLIQIKPYLAFFCVYQMRPVISKRQKKLLNQIVLVCWFLLIPVGIAGAMNEMNFKYLIGLPTNYAAAITASALIYFFTSEGTKLNKLVFIILLAMGLCSGRSKFYGFFVFSVACVLYFNSLERLKFNFKTILSAIILCAAILFVARDKIQFYFMQGVTGEVELDYIARMALYVTSFSIFQDYFPFGSGFASFGTHFSGVYYSDIYEEYGISSVWGLTKSNPKFITDTYYPSLAQFGVVGVVLYMLFWLYIIRKSIKLISGNKNVHTFAVVLSIIGFFLIENVADATFTGNRGIFMMMFLGYIFSNLNSQKQQLTDNI